MISVQRLRAHQLITALHLGQKTDFELVVFLSLANHSSAPRIVELMTLLELFHSSAPGCLLDLLLSCRELLLKIQDFCSRSASTLPRADNRACLGYRLIANKAEG